MRELLNITMTATVTRDSYISILNDNATSRITEKSGYIRNIHQFRIFLIEGANHKPGFNLTGKLNPGDNSLTLTLKVRLNTVDDEIIIYTIELTKIHKVAIARMEEMMLDFSNTLSNFPINEEKIRKIMLDFWHTSSIFSINEEKIQQMINEKMNKLANVVSKKMNKVLDVDKILGEMMDEMINNKLDEALNKINKKLDEEIDKRLDNKINKSNEMISEKLGEIFDEKIDEIFDEKLDVEIDEKLDEEIYKEIDKKINEKLSDKKLDQMLNEKFNTKNELAQIINDTKNELIQLIDTTNIDTEKKLMEKIRETDRSTTDIFSKLLSANITKNNNNFTTINRKIQGIFDRNNLK